MRRDDDDFDDSGPRTWTRVTAYTQEDGSISGTWRTNDNDERGTGDSFSEMRRTWRGVDEFQRSEGYSRKGMLGADVRITLDGADFTEERHRELARAREPARDL